MSPRRAFVSLRRFGVIPVDALATEKERGTRILETSVRRK
jgi:hypothetical protein